MQAANRMLDEAAEAVAERPEIRSRVEQIRLSLLYAQLEQAKRIGAGEYGLFERTPDGGWQVQAKWPKLLDRLSAY